MAQEIHPAIIPEARILAAEAFVAAELANPAWNKAAEIFDRELPTTPIQRLDELADLSKRWDGRNGAERNGAKLNVYVEQVLENSTKQQLFEEARDGLGQNGTVRPAEADTNTIQVITGAKVTGQLMRALHTTPGAKAYTGSERPLAPDEIQAMAQLFPEVEGYAHTEAGALHVMLEHLYPVREVVEGHTDDHFKAYNTPEGIVIWNNVPREPGKYWRELSDDPPRDRANTADTLRATTLALQSLDKELGSDFKTFALPVQDVYAPFFKVDAYGVFQAVGGASRTHINSFTPQDGKQLVDGAFPNLETPVAAAQRHPSAYAQEWCSTIRSLLRLQGVIFNSKSALESI